VGEIIERVIPKTGLEWTGERLTTAVVGQVEVEHLHRYFLAREICRRLDVLDIAAGEGYGSALLAQAARSVVAIDISATATSHAAAAYQMPNLWFVRGDARSIPLQNACVDIVVCFETIEHFYEHDTFMREVRRVLKPGGKLVVSSPERDAYSSTRTSSNPYHMRELTRTEFMTLMQSTFQHVVVQGQQSVLGSALIAEPISADTHRTLTFERTGDSQFEASVGLRRPPYLIAVASDVPVTGFPESLYIERSTIDDALVVLPATQEEHSRASQALAEAACYVRELEAQLTSLRVELGSVVSEHGRASQALAERARYARELEAQLTSLRVQLGSVISSKNGRISRLRRTRFFRHPRAVILELVSSLVRARVTPIDATVQPDAKSLLNELAQTDLHDFVASGRRISFFDAGVPSISVIIVLCNQAHLTLRCLRALQREALSGEHPPFEILLVDNASSDKTRELLSRLDGPRVMRNEENLGFVRAANQAAAAARGRALLFLNNDAFVRSGALATALAGLERSSDVGAVGGRLILPSGLLQEAGSIIWSDASTLGYGRGLAPDAGEVMFRRDVDYCSGAFLMTPRDVWERLGGFNESYAPAYYEESDYCMRLWKAGYRVVYEPAIAVDHYEFGSELNPGDAIAASVANRKRFRARHAEALRFTHFPPMPPNVLFARERLASTRRRLLVIDNEVPIRALGSGYPRMCELLKEAVAAEWSVAFFPIHRPNVDWDAARHDIPWEIEILSGRAVPGIAGLLEERLGYYDAVLISRPDNMELLRPILTDRPHLMGGTRLIYDAEALFANRTITEAAFEGRPMSARDAEQLVNVEIALAQSADAITCVTEAEAQVFRTRQLAPVYVLGHSTDVRSSTPGFETRNDFLFVGRLLEPEAPNWRGLAWFLRSVWGLIRARLPKASLLVVGHLNSNFSELEAPGVLLTGPVADLCPIYDAARVFVAPITFAAGLPHKITEATEAGLPTVATRLMARQLGWTPGIEIMAEDDPAAFAFAAVNLHENGKVWRAVRAAAQNRLAREQGSENFRTQLRAVLNGTPTALDLTIAKR
jgi:GT2 family glycosyltransferase/SAM-dependent methyltransferase